ncbi:MAG: nucleoside hydrolase [Eubacterium sp.]
MEKRKVIIDCDPGIDDALAIMLACRCEELDILGLTIVSGNITGIQCAENALQILKIMGRLDIPVYLGETKPLKRENITAEETHGNDGLGGVHFEKLSGITYKMRGIDFLVNTLKTEKNISILAIGPLTNIASLIKKDKQAASNIKELVLMGGAFKSHGNCSPVAEFNFWADPNAAEIVLNDLKRPITMVGLDVTRKVVLTPNYIELLHQLHNPIADFIVNITRFYTDFHWKQERTLGCVINDPLAIAYFINPELCDGTDYYVDVITEGKAIGMSVVDCGGITEKPTNCHVLTNVKAKEFMILLMIRLFPEHKKDILTILNDPKYSYE